MIQIRPNQYIGSACLEKIPASFSVPQCFQLRDGNYAFTTGTTNKLKKVSELPSDFVENTYSRSARPILVKRRGLDAIPC